MAGEWITLDDNESGVSMMSYKLGREPVLFRPVAKNLFDVEERLKDMVRDGVRTQVLSVPPAMWRYDLDEAVALQWCTAVNRSSAESPPCFGAPLWRRRRHHPVPSRPQPQRRTSTRASRPDKCVCAAAVPC